MRTIDGTVLTTLARARSFIDSHLLQLGTIESAGYRQKLTDAIDALQHHAVDQEAAHRASEAQLARQHALVAALRLNHMRPIAMIAAAQLRDAPEFAAFRMPDSHLGATELLIAGEAMAKVARDYAPVFISGGLAADFVDQLEAAAESLRQCMIDRQMNGTRRSAATAGLRAEASRGRKVLRVLSSLIEPQLKDDQSLLAGWRSARHIRRSGTPQPVVFPLLGLLSAQVSASGALTATTGTPADTASAGPAQLALPPAPIPEPFVEPEAPPQSSAFSRAAQIISDDADPAAPIS